jgi:hypothetical protein
MYFDFRRIFAKIPLQTPVSRGRIEGKANTRGLGVWLLQSLTFGSLAAAFGACFLRFQKATLGNTMNKCIEINIIYIYILMTLISNLLNKYIIYQ